jgi:hypothetical protein
MGVLLYKVKNGAGVAVILGVDVTAIVGVAGIVVGTIVEAGVAGAAQAESNSSI